MGFGALIVAAQLAAGGATADETLVAAAAASPRPIECRPSGPAPGKRLWERARRPELARYCLLLARGLSRLEREPAEALELAREADALLPGRPAALVVGARAALALGDAASARASFEHARTLDAHALDDPRALHDWAVSEVATGRFDEAARAYRAVIPRVAIVADEATRLRILIEAALAVPAADPTALDEAIGYVREARRRFTPPGLGPYVLAALALCLDRAGRADEARGAIAEVGGPWGLAEEAQAPVPSRGVPRILRAELHAMVAVVAEREDAELAKDSWRAYLSAAGEGTWSAHAKQKLAALERRRAKGR